MKKIKNILLTAIILLLLFNTSSVIAEDKNKNNIINLNSILPVICKIAFNNSIIGLQDTNPINLKQFQKKINNIDIAKNVFSSQIPIMIKISGNIKQEKEENIDYSKSNTNDYKSKTPLVLIYHTHATESYSNKEGTTKSYRSKDEEKNMIAIGKEVARILNEEYGIEVYQDTSLHDSPDYNSAYDNSLNSAKAILKKHPTIKYVFDIHRDGVPKTESAINKYLTEINGKEVARVMMVLGMNYKGSEKNKAFSQKLKTKFDEMYPNLCISTVIREQYRYNQFLCPNSILFEVGSNLSTLENAKQCATYIGRVIGEVIKNDQSN